VAAEVDRLEQQLRRAFEGEAWHGPSVFELLADVSATQAASRPIVRSHSIWELVLHIRSDYDFALRLLSGDGHALTASEAWPACPTLSDANWQQTVRELAIGNDRLRRAMREFPDERLGDALVAGNSETAYTLFSGVTQHNLYHAGQIALLKQVLAAQAL
jgi:uncharacterized damage-inducible protein DinB